MNETERLRRKLRILVQNMPKEMIDEISNFANKLVEEHKDNFKEKEDYILKKVINLATKLEKKNNENYDNWTEEMKKRATINSIKMLFYREI